MVLATLALVPQTACTFGREFRAVATPAFQQGVSQILNGLVDGIFAAIAPEPEGTPDTSRDL